jgi:RNA polymerase sigma-70 factor (ECF subfamily)
MLVSRHFSAISAFFRGKSPGDAEDLTQRTFYRFCRAKRGFRGESSVRTWLFQIARRLVIDHARGQRRQQGRETIDLESIVDPGRDYAELTAHSCVVARLASALRQIPIEEQRVLGMHYWHGTSHVEIAAILAIPIGTVKSRVLQGRRRLREALVSGKTSDATRGSIESWLAELDVGPRPAPVGPRAKR